MKRPISYRKMMVTPLGITVRTSVPSSTFHAETHPRATAGTRTPFTSAAVTPFAEQIA